MAMQKEEVIANLYGLRAGLSVISQEHDKIKAAENKFKDESAELSEKSNALENDIQKSQSELERRSNNINDNIKEYKIKKIKSLVPFIILSVITIIFGILFVNLKREYGVTTIKPYYCGAVFGVALLCIFLLVTNILDVLEVIKNSILSEILDCCIWSDFLSNFICATVILGGIGCSIATIPLFIDCSKDKGALYCGLVFTGIVFFGLLALIYLIRTIIYSINHKSYKTEKVECESKEVDFQTELKNFRAKSAEMQMKKTQINRRRECEIAPHVVKVKDTYAVLRKGFCSILDERDWQNVDLVIYYLETRRADTLKEALQLVDRELQTQRIENLICDATQCIVNTLNEGFRSMQQSLAVVYNGLSQQLSGISSQLSNMNSTLVSSQVMNQALMAKMNVTSNQMVSELREIKNNAEYMRLKLT